MILRLFSYIPMPSVTLFCYFVILHNIDFRFQIIVTNSTHFTPAIHSYISHFSLIPFTFRTFYNSGLRTETANCMINIFLHHVSESIHLLLLHPSHSCISISVLFEIIFCSLFSVSRTVKYF